jgi:hypothetical protein
VTRRAGAHVVVADIQSRQAEETALRVAAETGRRTLAAPIRLWGVAALDALGVSAEEASGRLLDIWRPAAPLPEHSRALLAHIGTACDRMHAWRARGCPVLGVE